jgi:hypothetical protein
MMWKQNTRVQGCIANEEVISKRFHQPLSAHAKRITAKHYNNFSKDGEYLFEVLFRISPLTEILPIGLRRTEIKITTS